MTTYKRILQFGISAVAYAAIAGTSQAQMASGKLGEVSFKTSCSAAAQTHFDTGLLQLHHMMYTHAALAFEKAASADPACAMAQWGIAMSMFHPLWPGGPTPDETNTGQAAAARLAELDTGSQIEAAFAKAALAFYDGDDTAYRARLANWAAAQRSIPEANPDDHEAIAFAALAQLTAAPRGPAAVPELKEAGAMMDALRIDAPLHPAAYHYAIHAYDHPALAERGLDPSRAYLEIAPENPHALHMPTHIFTRLGLWEESADLNARSAKAVIDMSGPDVLSGHYIHAMDYAIYAHLQLGNMDTAAMLLAEMEGHPNHQNVFGTAYAAAAAPSRLPLEQDDWEAAAKLPAVLHPAVSWERYPQAVVIRWFAIGLGAARSDNPMVAQNALSEMSRLRTEMEQRDAKYWLALLDAQTAGIEAWLAFYNGDNDVAMDLMRKAANVEDEVGKAPVTPGHVLPARELLGDLLLELGDKAGAAEAYQSSLATSPNRRRSLRGLALSVSN